MKKFLIPILFAGVLSSFATTTNVVYIDVNNLQDFEIQMSPETGETNVINFKVYQDRSALDLSGLTPVLYAARDEAISRNVITIEGSSSGNVATITTAGVNLSQGMSELYLRLDFRSGKNPSKYTYPYRVKGKMLILENPITQTGDPVLIGELYFAPASITNDLGGVLGSAAYASTNDFVALAGSGAGETFYADGSGGGTWAAAATPSNGITQAVADLLYAPLSITNDLGVVAGNTEANRLLIDELASATSTVAESVVNLSYVVNPSLWGLSINGDLEPMGVSAGLLDDGLFAIDLSTGDLMITGNQSTRFWQVSGSDIYMEVN